ncbi:hypothetical protein QR79_19150 [Methylobacterium indicum]|uniref:Transposase n=1 Tax=Methylobacterium indicum TaxID=1775910 RepID=A0ABR5H7H1_9HYPH|nr:hypothetical protein QR79_19150 [Methylobacterium indicum]
MRALAGIDVGKQTADEDDTLLLTALARRQGHTLETAADVGVPEQSQLRELRGGSLEVSDGIGVDPAEL